MAVCEWSAMGGWAEKGASYLAAVCVWGDAGGGGVPGRTGHVRDGERCFAVVFAGGRAGQHRRTRSHAVARCCWHQDRRHNALRCYCTVGPVGDNPVGGTVQYSTVLHSGCTRRLYAAPAKCSTIPRTRRCVWDAVAGPRPPAGMGLRQWGRDAQLCSCDSARAPTWGGRATATVR